MPPSDAATPDRPADARARVRALRSGGDRGDRDAGAGWVPDLRSRQPGVRSPAAAPTGPRPDHGPGGDGGDQPHPAGDHREDEEPEQEAAERDRAPWAARLVRRGPWGALAERWVPEPLRGARVDPGRRGAALLSVIAALAAVAAAVGVWWSRPQPRPVAPVTSVTSDAVPIVSASSPVSAHPAAGTVADAGDAPTGPVSATPVTPSPTGPMLISVTGRVRDPGVVTVAPDARVADAIAAAGGALDPSDLTGLNLAAHLSDGDSVVVAGPSGSRLRAEGSPAAGAPAGALTSSAVAPVDLNTADQSALEQLPGVGPVTASAIIAWRTEHGPFTDVAQLQAVSGIGPATYARLAPRVTI